MIALIVGATLALGGPAPPEVAAWFHDEAPALVVQSEKTDPILTDDPFAYGPVGLTEPFPELAVEVPAFDLSTGTADGPTTPDAVLRRGDAYCALVVRGGRSLGGVLCVDQLEDGSIAPRELEAAYVTNERPFDGVFRYDGGLFAMLGDEVLALGAGAGVHVPHKRGDAAQFFAMLTRRTAEADAVGRLGEDHHGFYPTLLGPQDHPEWDALVAQGMTLPEGYVPPPEPMYPGPEPASYGSGSEVQPGRLVAATLVVTALATAWFARRRRRRQAGIVDVSMTKR